MKIDLFDRYDIRTRICAFIFVVSPFLLDAYILVDAVRTFSSTVVITTVLIAGSGLFTCWMRYWGNSVNQVDYIAEFLMAESSEISTVSRKRYCDRLAKLEFSFSDLYSEDPNARKDAARSASAWLREKTRTAEFKLVQEENLNYGFLRNIYSVKSLFIGCLTVYSVVLIVAVIITNWDLSPKEYFLTMPVEHIACGIVHLSAYLIWIFGVNRNIIDFTAKKYAKAVVCSIDKL